LKLSPAEAAQHLLNRRKSRTDITRYASVIDVPGRPVAEDEECELFHPVETQLAAHHKILLAALQQVSQTPYGRLMVLMPPGSAKSTYASVVFPTHYLGQEGGRRVILTSYGADLARKMGRRSRSIIRQDRYQRIFNCTLSGDSQSAEQFTLTNGSEYMASGLHAGITGNRANGAIVDDPVKGREDASSEVMREKTFDAYQNDLLTRLSPGGWVVVIQTRWDEDDLAGRILPSDWSGESGMIKCRDGNTWNVLSVQAKCETHTDPLHREMGQYLWPEWFDARHWEQFERNSLTWNSLFQQRPRPLEGSFFLESTLLENGVAPPFPKFADFVFATIDSGVKTGITHSGLGVVYWACNLYKQMPHPLYLLDWDYLQVEGASLIEWLPSVFVQLEIFARQCKAQEGVRGAFVEDKASGTILLQQASNRDPPLNALPIDSKLTAMGKDERAINAGPYTHAGDVKICAPAWERTVIFKDVSKNHLRSQVLGFRVGNADKIPNDLLDCFSYGVAIALGNYEGF
jgi:hypothetical protein